jgi:chromosome segregation ATPase
MADSTISNNIFNSRINDDRDLERDKDRGSSFAYVQKKKKDYPHFDNLSDVISNANKPEAPKKGEKDEYAGVVKKLNSIGSELDDIQSQVDAINAGGAASIDDVKSLLTRLQELKNRLDEIDSELQDIASKNRLKQEEAQKQQSQLSQVGLLRNQIDAQRDSFQGNDNHSEEPHYEAPVSKPTIV